ncbi:MAG TPA: nucleotide disphospho-sugar-binding domain-containing protein [Candidatus Limnocylindrales bacterium]|nr:nucleotide disphospho-sugar-binding domain-containing protein [Candidatus Limnocylindrales bacterium]
MPVTESMRDPSARRTVVFFPEGAFGPTNNCVGIGQILRERGHRVVFIVEESFAGTLEAKGFEERRMRLAPPPAEPEVPGQFWIDFIAETAPVFRTSTLEQLQGFIAPTFSALIDGARYVDDRLREIIDELDPAVIVEDNVVAFPALPASGRPWVRIASCNPAEIKDPAIPPFSSGYPVADRSAWPTFLEEVDRTHRELWQGFDAFCRERGAPGLTWPAEGPDFIHESPWLNLFLYPRDADYRRERPLSPTWHRLESSVRAIDPAEAGWELPPHIRSGDGALIYLSLGSLGSADTGLMQRLIDVMATTRHRVVVSMGPIADRLRLADNMTGAGFLPQPAILPLVDLVITHGGNNTVTESFHHGKPMVVLPLFWDQVDNAQRLDETGFGVRLPAYAFDDEQLTGAIDRLLGDDRLRGRLAAIAERLQADPGTRLAANLIEHVARTGEPVLRSRAASSQSEPALAPA